MQRKITPQAFRKNILGVQVDGSKTKYRVSERWMYMLDAPFKIGSGCCTEMKKKPLHKFAKESGKVPFIGTMAEESMLLNSGCGQDVMLLTTIMQYPCRWLFGPRLMFGLTLSKRGYGTAVFTIRVTHEQAAYFVFSDVILNQNRRAFNSCKKRIQPYGVIA